MSDKVFLYNSENTEKPAAVPGQAQPIVSRLHDPAVLRGIICRNTMQRLSADDPDAPIYVTAQDIADSIAIASEIKKSN